LSSRTKVLPPKIRRSRETVKRGAETIHQRKNVDKTRELSRGDKRGKKTKKEKVFPFVSKNAKARKKKHGEKRDWGVE